MTDFSTVKWPPSLWAATAPPAPALPALEGDQTSDVVIIGAGFTGLSTAIHLREMGVAATVIEAAEPGWGASGRNNGQVIPTLAGHDPSAMVTRHGEAGERFNAMLRDSAAYLFDLVRRYDIPAEAEQAGWVQPVHSPGRVKLAEKRVREWSAIGAPVELLVQRGDRFQTVKIPYRGGLRYPWLERAATGTAPTGLDLLLEPKRPGTNPTAA